MLFMEIPQEFSEKSDGETGKLKKDHKFLTCTDKVYQSHDSAIKLRENEENFSFPLNPDPCKIII